MPKRLPKLTYAAATATIAAVLLFVVFNTAIVSKLITGLAVGYFSDATRESLFNMQDKLQVFLDGPALQASKSDLEILRRALRVTGANGIALRVKQDDGVYLSVITGDTSGFSFLTDQTQRSISPLISNKLSDQERALVRWIARDPSSFLQSDPSAQILQITPQLGGSHLVYVTAHTGKRFITLFFTPEDLLNNLSRFFPTLDAVLLLDGKVRYVSSGLAMDFKKVATANETFSLEDMLAGREKKYGVTTKELIVSDSQNFTLSLVAREADVLSLLIQDRRFFVSSLSFGLVIIAIFCAYMAYANKGKAAYKPSPPLTANQVRKRIQQGEGDHVEFKSTLRFNLKAEKNDKVIELAALKGIVAFLNTAGGTLLVGVDDDGNVLGLEKDSFQNTDHLLRHISNLIAEHIGIRHINSLSLHAVELEEKTVLAVVCRQALEPVFLTHKNSEQFFVRQGPGNRSLTMSEFWQVSEKFR